MRRLTVPVVAAAAAVLLTLAVTSMTSKAADTSAEWAHKSGNPAW